MPATSITSVMMPASFFSRPSAAEAAWVIPLAWPFASLSATCLTWGARSCLPKYSEEGSRWIGVACLERAIVVDGRHTNQASDREEGERREGETVSEINATEEKNGQLPSCGVWQHV